MDWPVAFLDFDGVLRRHQAPHGHLEPALVANLHGVMRRVPTLHCVFSTTWRLRMGLDALREHFAPELRARFIGVTPELSSAPPAASFREILAWRGAAGHTGPWIAIDDQLSDFPEQCTRLCLCDPRRAFDDAAAARCTAALVSMLHGGIRCP